MASLTWEWKELQVVVEDVLRFQLLQSDASVHFEWGPVGARLLADSQGCLVVVDVLSFTTAVTVAAGRTMAVLPYPLADSGADHFAAANDATLAVRRRDMSPDRPWSLSPAALASAPYVPRLVLPSPNGSTIASQATGSIMAACLRNARASANWLIQQGFGTPKRPVFVFASGERWPDDSMRLALEDALGAGSVLSYLQEAGCELSVEASAIALAFKATNVGDALRTCGSAQELEAMGFGADVEMAAELN